MRRFGTFCANRRGRCKGWRTTALWFACERYPVIEGAPQKSKAWTVAWWLGLVCFRHFGQCSHTQGTIQVVHHRTVADVGKSVQPQRRDRAFDSSSQLPATVLSSHHHQVHNNLGGNPIYNLQTALSGVLLDFSRLWTRSCTGGYHKNETRTGRTPGEAHAFARRQAKAIP